MSEEIKLSEPILIRFSQHQIDAVKPFVSKNRSFNFIVRQALDEFIEGLPSKKWIDADMDRNFKPVSQSVENNEQS